MIIIYWISWIIRTSNGSKAKQRYAAHDNGDYHFIYIFIKYSSWKCCLFTAKEAWEKMAKETEEQDPIHMHVNCEAVTCCYSYYVAHVEETKRNQQTNTILPNISTKQSCNVM